MQYLVFVTRQPAGEQPAEVKIFRHPLLQHFMLSVFCKLPIQSMTRMAHLKQLLMLRIILSVFQFRINGRCVRKLGWGIPLHEGTRTDWKRG